MTVPIYRNPHTGICAHQSRPNSACRRRVYNGEDESVTALTDDGMEELEQMLSYARRSTQEWNDFLNSFVDDEALIARIKAKSPR